MRNDCTTCENGTNMYGMIYCNIEGRIKSNTSNTCKDYKIKMKQMKLGE